MSTILTGKQIKAIVKNNDDLSQAELSKICSVSTSLVSLWLNEKRPIPKEQLKLIEEYIDGKEVVSSPVNNLQATNNIDKYEEIRKDLLDQLERQNKYGSHYTDLVDHAVSYYKLKDELEMDIQVNGIRVKLMTGNGFEKEVDNASVKNINGVSSQLLRVLKMLGIDEDVVEQDTYDEDDYI